MSVLYHNIYLGEVCDSVDVYVHPMKDCDVTLMQVSMTQLESEEWPQEAYVGMYIV